MCKEEFQNTTDNRFSWNSRFKWFSSDKDFIVNRVKDGKFNNSRFIADRYSILVEIGVEDFAHFNQLNRQELMLDRRRANQIKIHYIRQI